MSKFRQIFLPCFSKPVFCFAVLLLFLSSQYATQSFGNSFILEKTFESEKEEDKIEEEKLESENISSGWTQKIKKIKKILPEIDVFAGKVLSHHSFEKRFSYLLISPLSCQFSLLFITNPRYLVFHSLIFYEI